MTGPNPLSFREDLSLARSGNHDALDRLLERTQPRFQRLAEARIGDRLRRHLRRSDVLQSTWLDVLRGIKDFDGDTEEQFVSWVGTILENNIRRQDRYFSARKRAVPERLSQVERLIKQLPKRRSPSPSSQFANQENLLIVSRALATLRDEYRQIILLAIVEDRSHKEIAELLGKSETAVRMLLCRSRAALNVAVSRLERQNRD